MRGSPGGPGGRGVLLRFRRRNKRKRGRAKRIRSKIIMVWGVWVAAESL